MTSRKTVFFWFVLGSVAYQLTKYFLGFPMTLGDTFDAAYWGAGALSAHWLVNRSIKTTR